MEKMKAHVGKMETQLQQWGAKLDKLVAKAETVGADTKLDCQKRVEDLKVKQQVARVKLDELKATGSENWEIVKVGVEKAWKDLEGAYKNLKF